MYKSLLHVLENTVRRSPEKVALIFKGRTFTYGELWLQVDRFAAELQELGIGRNQRVVICCGNRPETVVAFWGTLAAGATVAVVSESQSAEKISFIVDDCTASALVTERSLFEQLAPRMQDKPHLLATIVVDREETQFSRRDRRPLETISEDLAALIYTSGSTGEPKGVMMTHANMQIALASLNEYQGTAFEDVVLNVLPLSFDYGLYQMLMAFSAGATLVLERDMNLPLQFVKNIGRYQCTVLPAVPVMVEVIEQCARFGNFDLSSVRRITNTGAALLQRHIDSLKRLFPKAAIFSMYGLTECKRCTYLPPHLIDVKPGSVGIAIPNTEIMVVDEADQACAPNQIGQLVVRGGTVMQGYWRRPEETRQKIREHPVHGGRCLYTGDYGYLDEDGFFYFKGRMDEVVKVRGRKLIPREVEDALRQIAGVHEAAVIAMAQQDGDVEIVAFVESDESQLDHVRLATGCRERLERFQIPQRFVILTKLPRNENGKVDKPLLRRAHLEPAGDASVEVKAA
ncbi:MAG TPA: class I adenylate-forming enzyme family protein [Chloroflexota bacterium]